MNTEILQKKFEKTYKDFFNKYDFVFSIPLPMKLVWFSSWYLKTYKSILFKLPMRIYIWINYEKNIEKNITFYRKSNSINDFEKVYLRYFFDINNEIFRKIWINYDIWFLSEYNTDWNIILILFLALVSKRIKTNEISIKTLESISFDNYNYKDILINMFNKFEKELIFFKKNIDWLSYKDIIATSLMKSDLFVFFDRKEKTFDITTIQVKSWNNKLNFNKMFIYVINPNIPMSINFLWNKIKNWNDIKIKNLKQLTENLEKYFFSIIKKDLIDIYAGNGILNDFFLNINNYYNVFVWLLLWDNTRDLQHNFIRQTIINEINYTTINKDFFWILWLNNMVLITDKNLHIKKENVEKINNKFWYNLSLDFISYIDWFWCDWLKLEQSYISWYSSNFKNWYLLKEIKNKNINDYFVDYKIIVKKTLDWLLLDSISNKIFLFWEKLTSKDLMSQTWTIEILKILISKFWENVINRDFPSSSYSKNKNEMLWKIVIPLVKLIKKRTNKELSLTCHWSLWSFYVKFDWTDIPIYLIEKIN